MRFTGFDWDDRNIEHIARHGLGPHEVEGVCRGRHLILRGRHGCYAVYGRTGEGRLLFIVLRRFEGGVARVITARDMTINERRFYQRRH